MARVEVCSGEFSLSFHSHTLSWIPSIEVNGGLLDIKSSCYEEEKDSFCFFFSDLGLRWRFRIVSKDGEVSISSELENLSDHSLSIGKVFLFNPQGPAFPSWNSEDTLFFAPSTAQFPKQVHRLSEKNVSMASTTTLQLYNPSVEEAIQIAFATFFTAYTEVSFQKGKEEELSELRALCDYSGWELLSKERKSLETLLLSFGTSPFQQLERWAEKVAASLPCRQWSDPPIGWIGGAWGERFGRIREEAVLENCDAISRRLQGFSIKYIWVSIANIENGQPGNWLEWAYDKFPSGPELFGRQVAEKGFILGLWCGMFWISSHLPALVEKMRDALLKDEKNELIKVCPVWNHGDSAKLPKSERPCCYGLDASHPMAIEFLKHAFAGMRKWGVRYYMLDFLEGGAGALGRFPYAQHHNPSLVAGPEVFREGLRAVRESAGDDTYLLACTGPTFHSVGYADAVRTGNDFGEGRAIHKDSFFYPASYVINNSSHWTAALAALVNQASAYYTHRKLYLNDSGNVLTVDKPLPLKDARIHATIHAMSGGPTMLGDDIERIDDERLSLIKKTLPRSRDVAVPLDLFDSPSPDYPKIFHRTITRPWGRFDVIAVYNFTDTFLSKSFLLSRCGLSSSLRFLVWEFWESAYVGGVSEKITFTVPPGSVAVYRITEDRGIPVVLGTDMHLLMGEMELFDCHWDSDTRSLSGAAFRPAGERGSIFLSAPSGLKVKDHRGLSVAKDGRDDSLIIRVPLIFEGKPIFWKVGFEDA
ncbi:MAG: hypothetical protein WDA18_06675 [Candidatus Ratteibacteria bacterium]|jgi:hypothetical protein